MISNFGIKKKKNTKLDKIYTFKFYFKIKFD